MARVRGGGVLVNPQLAETPSQEPTRAGAVRGGGVLVNPEARLAQQKARREEMSAEPGVFQKVTGGLLGGLREEPAIGFLLNKIIDQFPDATQEQLDRYSEKVKNSTIAQAFEIVGEYGPQFYGLGKLFQGGRFLARQGVAAFGNKKIAEVGVAKAIETQVGRTALRQLPQRKQALIEKMLVPKGEQAGSKLLAIPAAERYAEVLGGNLAIGAGIGAEEAIQGAPLGESARTALVAAAFGAGLEGSLSVIGRQFIRSTRMVDRAVVNSWWGETAKPALEASVASLESSEMKLIGVTQKVLGVKTQQMDLFRGAELAKVRGTISKAERVAALEAESAGYSLTEGIVDFGTKAGRIAEGKALGTKIKQVRSDIKAAKTYLEEGPTAFYRSERPYNPDSNGFRLLLAKGRLNLIQTPESLKGMFGRMGMKVFESFDEVFSGFTMLKDQNIHDLKKSLLKATQAMGFKGKNALPDSPSWYPVQDAWELSGEAGLREYMATIGRADSADDIVEVFLELKTAFTKAHQPLVAVGAERAFTASDKRTLGVTEFMPHRAARIDDGDVRAKMIEALGETKAHTLFEKTQRDGLAKNGSIDYNRHVRGTLQQKINGTWVEGGKPLPFNPNMWDNSLQYLNEAGLRNLYAKKFGFTGTLNQKAATGVAGGGAAEVMTVRDILADAMIKEGSSPALTSMILDIGLQHKYYDQAMRRASQIFTSVQTAEKMGLGVVANMTQPMNNILMSGLRATVRGGLGATKGVNRDVLMANTALAESVITTPGTVFGGRALAGSKAGLSKIGSVAERVAYGVLTYTGFSAVERWNRVWSGMVGHTVLLDTIGKGLRGQLRGKTLDISRRRFQAMGLNLDDVLKQVREGGDEFLAGGTFDDIALTSMFSSHKFAPIRDRAQFKTSQTTQFNPPSPLRTPILWSHPLGRVATQFKSFALGQGRFIRDAVFAEAAQGNLAPMAYFLSIYPIAGEAVGDIKALIKDKERKSDGVLRFAENMSYVGGIGMFTDLWSSAKWGAGSVLEFGLGPTASDAADLLSFMVRGDAGGALKQVQRTPTYHVVSAILKAPVVTTAALFELADVLKDRESTPTPTTIDLGTLRSRDRALNKQP